EPQLGSVVVASSGQAIPGSQRGAFRFRSFFAFATGYAPAGTRSAVGYRTSGLTVGISIVKLPDGTVVAYRQRSDPPPGGAPTKEDVPINPGSPSGKRATWREIMQ